VVVGLVPVGVEALVVSPVGVVVVSPVGVVVVVVGAGVVVDEDGEGESEVAEGKNGTH
jgi:hypothetical protein